MSSKDRDVLQFLWWKNGEIGSEVEVYRMCVHLFGGVWSPSCASFALRRVAVDHKMNFPEETIRTVLKNFYADDCLKAVGTTEGAINIVRSLCQLLALGGFRLTKWVSNDRRVLEAVPVEERAKGSRTLILTVVLCLLREHWGSTGTLRPISLVSRLRESRGSLPGEDS